MSSCLLAESAGRVVPEPSSGLGPYGIAQLLKLPDPVSEHADCDPLVGGKACPGQDVVLRRRGWQQGSDPVQELFACAIRDDPEYAAVRVVLHRARSRIIVDGRLEQEVVPCDHSAFPPDLGAGREGFELELFAPMRPSGRRDLRVEQSGAFG